MGAVATLVLLGFIALAMAAPDIQKAIGRADAAPNIRGVRIRKFQSLTLIFEVGIALAVLALARFLHIRNIDVSAVTTDQVLRAGLIKLSLMGIPGAYVCLCLRLWQLRREYRRPDGTLLAEDARRIGSLDMLKSLFLVLMAASLLLLLIMRYQP